MKARLASGIILGVAIGMAVGVGAYTFVYARGYSYMTNNAVVAAQDFQRRAQFYVDFIESENSTGFHAPQEAARILGESINFSRKGQVGLRGGIQSASGQAK